LRRFIEVVHRFIVLSLRRLLHTLHGFLTLVPITFVRMVDWREVDFRRVAEGM
jgi:hypothetical protein